MKLDQWARHLESQNKMLLDAIYSARKINGCKDNECNDKYHRISDPWTEYDCPLCEVTAKIKRTTK